MNLLKTAGVTILCGLLQSCALSTINYRYYYQVYEVSSNSEAIRVYDDLVVYEDDSCAILYNFWDNGGNAGFAIVNKTDENLYIDKSESFFVKNGVASNYYQGFVYTETRGVATSSSESTVETASLSRGASASASVSASKTLSGFNPNANPISHEDFWQAKGASVGMSASFEEMRQLSVSSGMVETSSSFSSNSVQWEEEKVVVIPPHTTKYIKDRSINSIVYRYEGLYRNPRGAEDIKPVELTKENSPIVFTNVISYRVGKDGSERRVTNEFYLSEIANYPSDEVGKQFAPDKFYLRYAY